MSGGGRLMVCAWFVGATLASPACTKSEPPTPVTARTTTGEGMVIEFRSESDPPTSGNNTFEVTVRKDGTAVTDATVTVTFSMPAMPTMNMPAMSTDVTLTHAGEGTYRGAIQLSMAGTWTVAINATRAGAELGTQRFSVVAK